jgi:hypothetical protein
VFVVKLLFCLFEVGFMRCVFVQWCRFSSILFCLTYYINIQIKGESSRFIYVFYLPFGGLHPNVDGWAMLGKFWYGTGTSLNANSPFLSDSSKFLSKAH